MKLYKYRSLDHLEYTLDILLNERVHCAPYDKLNDPFEGVFLAVSQWTDLFGSTNLGFGSVGGGVSIKTPQSISNFPVPGGTRVCSLSASLNDVRLWSHYANGLTGIAIEIDLDETEEKLHEVEYVKQFKEFSYGMLTAPESTEILRVKSHHWSYEKEYRVISKNEHYAVNGKLTAVFLGLRTPALMREMLIRSVGRRIPVFSTKLNENTIEIERDQLLNGTV